MSTDLTISVEDKPGGLAAIGEALGNAGINIEGLCGIGFEGRGIVHVCVEDGGAARSALEGAGVKVEGEAEAIVGPVVPDTDEPGTMGAMARSIANAGDQRPRGLPGDELAAGHRDRRQREGHGTDEADDVIHPPRAVPSPGRPRRRRGRPSRTA